MKERSVVIFPEAKASHSGVTQAVRSEPVPIIVLIVTEDNVHDVVDLLSYLPAAPGMTFIVLERPPVGKKDIFVNDKSERISLFQSQSKMKVQPVREGLPLERDHIYLLSASNPVHFVEGRCQPLPGFVRTSIETSLELFLSSVTAWYGEKTIVVSSLELIDVMQSGLRVVQMEGGYVFAMEDLIGYFPEDGSDFLPSAVDLHLSAGKIAEWLGGFMHGSGVVDVIERNIDAVIDRIRQLLLSRKGIDLSMFRPAAIARRVCRRIVLKGLRDPEQYTSLLETDEQELFRLHEEVLMYVTDFFPDPALMQSLTRTILPVVCQNKVELSPLRVWMPRCMGGEEVVTTAICIAEFLREKGYALTVQVFATDLNQVAIRKARAGFYNEEAVHNVPPRQLKRYFTKMDGGYLIDRSIKDICVFATHNLLKDPPFSHVDVIISRNLMVGFHGAEKQKLLQSFHYALNREGFLSLGKENIESEVAALFAPVAKAPGVYARLEAPAGYTHTSLQTVGKDGERQADGLLLSGYVPAGILVDEHYRVIRYYGHAEPYLRPSPDRLSLHLLKILRDELIFDLKDLFSIVQREEKAARREGILLTDSPEIKEIAMEVVPIISSGRKWRLVIVREVRGAQGEEAAGVKPIANHKDRKIELLEKELREARAQLMVSHEQAAKIQVQLSEAHQEAMASNEELQSLNEELQSINQALETARDDLQSYNLELNTVNADLYQRNKGLEQSAEYAHAIVAAIRQPLMVLQNDLRVRTANSYFCQLFHVTEDELIGHDLYHAADGLFDVAELRNRLHTMLRQRLKTMNFELRHSFARIGERILDLNLARMQDHSGKRNGILIAVEDITDRRLEERIKDEFIGIASHEIKTPAATIQAYSQLLLDEIKGGNDERSVLLVSRLNNQVSRLTRLTKDLLDVTRISQGQIQLRKSYFELNTLIGQTVDEMQMTTSVHLVIGHLPEMPAMWADRERVSQVLSNLLSNAIKYSEGAEEVRIYSLATVENVQISVQDFGIGMSAETLQRVFDRFYRSDDPAAMRHSGMGLGLYIASEIVRKHGGAITVRSEKGIGSTFTAIFPFGKPE